MVEMDINTLEIYLSDLKEESQEEVLKFLNADKKDNFDVSPLFVLENDGN